MDYNSLVLEIDDMHHRLKEALANMHSATDVNTAYYIAFTALHEIDAKLTKLDLI